LQGALWRGRGEYSARRKEAVRSRKVRTHFKGRRRNGRRLKSFRGQVLRKVEGDWEKKKRHAWNL